MSRANFVQVQLAAAATDIQTTLSVKAPVGGFALPPADGGRLVLTDSPGRPNAFEVVTYTSRTGSGPYTLDGVVRGREGTTGLAWSVDAFVLQSLTAGELDELLATKVDKAAGQSLMTDAERTKLAGIAAGAQVNTVTSVAGKTGAVTLVKGDVGLGNVDNTSDANKPVSTAQQAALDAKANLNSPALTGTPTAPTAAVGTNSTQIANTAFVQAVVAALVNGAPGALDQLSELAAAMGNDPDFATTMLNALALKAPLSSPTFTGDPKAPTPASTDNDTSIATTAFVRAAMALFGLNDPSTQQAWHAGNLVKQTNVDDLNAGRMVLTESVRRRLTGGFHNTYCDRLILLHPLYEATFIPYSIVDGKLTATRGATGASLNQTSAEVISSSAYNNHATALYDTAGNPADPWQAVSCTYQGVKYAALIVPYHQSGYGGGIFFEGRAVSSDSNQLLCIEYYNRQTATVLNAEVYNSITPLSVQKTLRVGGEVVYHRANILGTVSQSAGVPTGAIIERGSNANGEYVRFADGTQICTVSKDLTIDINTATGSIYRSLTAVFSGTYPASFAPSSVVTQSGQVVSDGGTNSNNYDSWLGHDDQMNSVTTYRSALMSATSKTGATLRVRMTAIGRWY